MNNFPVRSGRWGSTSTDTDEPFVPFTSRNDRKLEKRKEISPTADNRNTSDGGLYQASKRLKESNSRSYANIAAEGNANSADIRVSKEKPRRIVGKTIFSNLKAAPRDTSPLAVFVSTMFLLNIPSMTFGSIVMNWVSEVRFIYDISAVNQVAKAFKLAIGSNDASIVQDGKSWPVGVNVRSWRHYNRSDNMTTAPKKGRKSN